MPAARPQNYQEGCTKYCCTAPRLSAIPPMPAGTTWGEWAPHLTGRQIMDLSTRWERCLAANTRQPMRRCPSGWPADLGAGAVKAKR